MCWGLEKGQQSQISRGHHSCRWSLLLLLGLLNLSGIAEAITLTEMLTDFSSPPVIDRKVISTIGENVTFYCKTEFPLSGLSVWWYYLNQDGSHALIKSYPLDDYLEEPEYMSRISFIITSSEIRLILENVMPEDSGTYICVQKYTQRSVKSYMILQVTAPEEKDENSVVIYTLVGLLSAALMVWMISFSILCKRGDLQCPRNWGQEI